MSNLFDRRFSVCPLPRGFNSDAWAIFAGGDIFERSLCTGTRSENKLLPCRPIWFVDHFAAKPEKPVATLAGAPGLSERLTFSPDDSFLTGAEIVKKRLKFGRIEVFH